MQSTVKADTQLLFEAFFVPLNEYFVLYFSVLVGNKCDLDSNRQVTFEQGKALAQEWGVPFVETSAKTKIRNVDCFHEIVRQIRKLDKNFR